MFPVIFSFGPITIYSFGLLALIAFVFASFVVWKRGIEANLAEEDIFDSIVGITLSGLIGARIYHILFNFDRFGWSPLDWVSIFRVSGLSFIGGLLGGALVLWFIAKRKHWDYFKVSDVVVTGLALAQAIGWIGAFFSGFGVGKETRFGLRFVGYDRLRFPMQLVLALGFFLIYLFVWKVEVRYRTYEWYKGRKTSAQTGFLTFSYLIAYGLMLITVVLMSENSVYWLGLSRELYLGVIFITTGSVGLYIRSGRYFKGDLKDLKVYFFEKFKATILKQRKKKERSFNFPFSRMKKRLKS